MTVCRIENGSGGHRLPLGRFFLVIAAIMAPGFARAADCSITFNADDPMTEVINREHFDFQGYDALCAALQAGHLQVDIDSDRGVIDDKAFAWVRVRLARISTTVRSDIARSTTRLATPADEATAAKAEMDALNESLENVATERDAYIKSVGEEEARLRAALAAKPAGKP
jgi:hypothetical protein